VTAKAPTATAAAATAAATPAAAPAAAPAALQPSAPQQPAPLTARGPAPTGRVLRPRTAALPEDPAALAAAAKARERAAAWTGGEVKTPLWDCGAPVVPESPRPVVLADLPIGPTPESVQLVQRMKR
jgi:DNA polymerase-3 subunit gamma/tau